MFSIAIASTIFISTHHRGTERQNVADDYAKRLHIGQVECETVIADIAGTFIAEKSGSTPPQFQSCELLNVSICPATEQGNVRITINAVLTNAVI